jgi:hypothetical protein
MLNTYWNFQQIASEAFGYFIQMQHNTKNPSDENQHYALDTVILQEYKVEIKAELNDEELAPVNEAKFISPITKLTIKPNIAIKLEKIATEKPKRKRRKRTYERVECVYCSKMLVSKWVLRKHLLTHANER